MYYPDLSYYRIGDEGEYAEVFVQVKNVGWLSNEDPYPQGPVDVGFVKCLQKLVCIESGSKQSGISIKVHTQHIRGTPYKCPFCEDEIHVDCHGEDFTLGRNEIWIPAERPGEFYAFPTLAVHYVIAHGYTPPEEFSKAVTSFDFEKPFDLDEEAEDLKVVEMPGHRVNSYSLDSHQSEYGGFFGDLLKDDE